MTEKKLKTFFCVGDGKQSIFSFQGTDINLFKENRKIFQNKIGIENFKLPELNKLLVKLGFSKQQSEI
jgi:ATP-dependent exoDNAse (exonuclease V) beta subunit